MDEHRGLLRRRRVHGDSERPRRPQLLEPDVEQRDPELERLDRRLGLHDRVPRLRERHDDLPPTGTSVTVSGLSPSTTYSFSVASIDQAGTSAQSGAISVTTTGGGTAIVQLYQHCNYGGWVANFTGTGNSTRPTS